MIMNTVTNDKDYHIIESFENTIKYNVCVVLKNLYCTISNMSVASVTLS